MSKDLIDMISTKICHDIISSSQGILQGVEALEDEDAVFVEQSKIFIKDSAQSLNIKLVFFRSLCGRPGKLASVNEVRDFGGKYLDTINRGLYKINYDITGECKDITLLKSGLGFCSIATETLIRGGEFFLRFTEDSLVCEMKHERMKKNDLIFDVLEGKDVKLEPQNAISSYLMLILKEQDYKLSVLEETGKLEIRISK